jgi:predicted TPR repeat methyltransferase
LQQRKEKAMARASQRNLTSGDLTADRRADYAVMLAGSGNAAAAVELMEQALELAPLWAAGWYRLGDYAEKAGDTTKAIAAWRKTLALEPGDIFGARLKLAVMGEAELPTLPPSAYVEGLFDDYADRFDSALVETLKYTVPEKLAALIAAETSGRTFRLAVDLGCGTGLLAAALGDRADKIEGYDLSERMLAKASTKKLYGHLGKADLSLAPGESGLFDDFPRHRADLVAAADVMMYLGDLDAAFTNAAALLAPTGCLRFRSKNSRPSAALDSVHRCVMRIRPPMSPIYSAGTPWSPLPWSRRRSAGMLAPRSSGCCFSHDRLVERIPTQLGSGFSGCERAFTRRVSVRGVGLNPFRHQLR